MSNWYFNFTYFKTFYSKLFCCFDYSEVSRLLIRMYLFALSDYWKWNSVVRFRRRSLLLPWVGRHWKRGANAFWRLLGLNLEWAHYLYLSIWPLDYFERSPTKRRMHFSADDRWTARCWRSVLPGSFAGAKHRAGWWRRSDERYTLPDSQKPVASKEVS